VWVVVVWKVTRSKLILCAVRFVFVVFRLRYRRMRVKVDSIYRSIDLYLYMVVCFICFCLIL